MGSGFYSQALSYEQWYNFNSAQRAHLNFVEWAPSTYAFLLIGGIYFSIASAVLGLIVLISRAMYAIGYNSKGPGGRLIGAILNDLAILGLFGLSIASSI
jgi:glutathione S-transferase